MKSPENLLCLSYFKIYMKVVGADERFIILVKMVHGRYLLASRRHYAMHHVHNKDN